MDEQEELHDEDVIVVISDEEGAEHYYREEMIVPLGTERARGTPHRCRGST